MLLTAAIAGLVILGLFLSMLSSSPSRMDRYQDRRDGQSRGEAEVQPNPAELSVGESL